MKHASEGHNTQFQLDLSVFEAIRGMRLLLLPDAPHFTIAAVSNDVCVQTGISKLFIVGKSVLSDFFGNNNTADDTSQSMLRQSLNSVLTDKREHLLATPVFPVPSTERERPTFCAVQHLPVVNNEGDLTHIICTLEEHAGNAVAEKPASDRQEGEQANARLPEGKTWYHDLLESLDQGFCIFDMIFDEHGKPVDYFFVDVNSQFEHHTGMKDAAGKRMREMVPNHDEHWFEIYGKVALTGEPVRFQQNSESLKRWFDLYAFRIGGTESRTVAVLFSDITQRKLDEVGLVEKDENLRNIIHNAPVAMFIFRGEKMIIDTVNALALQMIGRTQSVVGKPLLEAVPELTDQPAYQVFQEVYRTGVAQYGLEVLVPLERNGKPEQRYFNFAYTPLMENGRVVGVMDVATEVTEQVAARKQIEEVVAHRTKELAEANQALQSSNKELQRSNANLEEFAHAASHDLKEPIRKIHFFTHQLKDQLGRQLQEREIRSFNRIEVATQRMSNLIEDLLLYSHVSERPHEKERIDLSQKIRRVLEDLELDIEEKRAVVQVDHLPVVLGYRRQLQQLFQNLLANALKYSKAGVPPEINITATLKEEEGTRYHVIEVKDNGIGFDQQYADKVFQIFARLHGKQEYSGTGVGLSIVKKVAENHNGFIRVQSVPGQGSAFSVYLPVEE